MSLRLAAKYSHSTNSLRTQIKEKVDRSNYTYETNRSSPVLSLDSYDFQNLHVKMVKIMLNLALIALRTVNVYCCFAVEVASKP